MNGRNSLQHYENKKSQFYQDVALFDVNVSDFFLNVISNKKREIGSIAIVDKFFNAYNININ